MADSTHKTVAVIGGGISGLVCAYRLHRLGMQVTLLEESSRAGGLIGSVERDGFLCESGPQSVQGTVALMDLIRELGIEGELCIADPRAPRFVLRHGRLRKVPLSPQALLTSSLLGVGSRWRLFSEAFRTTRPPKQDESVADFVRRKFGHEILEYLVAPFVSGVYAGDPEKLSLRAAFPSIEEWEREHGSVLRGAMKSRPAEKRRERPPSLCSFRRGLETLTNALASKLGPGARTGARASAINRKAANGEEGYEVHLTRDGGQETILAQAVVLATPAYVASRLVAPVSPPLAQTLSGVAYAPVAVVAAGYYTRQAGTPVEGFGVLIPRVEKLRTLGTVWNSSLFPGRAPVGKMLMTSFAGGATDPELPQKPDQEIAAIVEQENARILEIAGAPIASAVWKHPRALPQYNLGHGHVVRAIREGEDALPGLFFAGNYLKGPAVGKCVEQALETAEAVHAYLQDGRQNR